MALPLAFAVAGTALDVIGGISGGRAKRRAAKRRAAILRAQAEERRRVTGLQVDAFKKKAKVQMGENISAFAKAGVDISQSPLLVITQNEKEAGNQAAEIRRAGFEEARLLEAGASNAISEGRAAGRAANIGAFGTLLGGIGSALKD